MEEEKIDAKYGALVTAYQNKVEMLSSLIDKLEDRKKKLDTVVGNHQGFTLDIQAAETKLLELLKEIDIKKQITLEVSQSLSELTNKKLLLQGENEQLQAKVDAKKNYIADIGKYPAMVKALQEEMEAFQNEHSENKRKAEQEIEEIKNKARDIHQHAALIFNK